MGNSGQPEAERAPVRRLGVQGDLGRNESRSRPSGARSEERSTHRGFAIRVFSQAHLESCFVSQERHPRAPRGLESRRAAELFCKVTGKRRRKDQAAARTETPAERPFAVQYLKHGAQPWPSEVGRATASVSLKCVLAGIDGAGVQPVGKARWRVFDSPRNRHTHTRRLGGTLSPSAPPCLQF